MLLAVQRNWLLKIPLSSPRCSVQFVWSCCSLEIFELCSDPLQKFCWEHFCWSRRKTNPDPCYFNKMSGDCVHTSGWHVPGRPLLCRWHPNNHSWAALGFGKHNLMVSLADASTNISVWKFGHTIFSRSILLLLSFEFFISLFPHPICSCWSCFRPDIVNYFNTAICFAHSAHDPHQSHRKWNEEVDPGKGLWWAAYCVTGLWTSRAAALIGIILLFTKETTIFYMKSIFPVLIMLASYRKWEFASDTLCWVSCKLSWDLRWSQEITWGNIQGSFLVKCWLCERDLWWKLRPGEDSEGRENGESQVERERRGN